MHLGITDHVWTIGELVGAALDGVVEPAPKKRYGPFIVVEGGME